jgi:hypothetical protein
LQENGNLYVKKNKPDSKKANTAYFLSYAESTTEEKRT